MNSAWVVGHLTIEDVVMSNGTTSMSTMGGNVVYAAVSAALAGNRLGIVSRIGCDYPSDALSDLEATTLPTWLTRVPVKSVRQWCLYEPDGSRVFLLHSASGGYDGVSPLPQEGPRSDSILGIHIAPMPAKYQRMWVQYATDLGITVSLDPHHDVCASEPDSIWQLVGKLSVFAPSELEVRLLYGSDLEAAARAFLAAGARLVVIKTGSDGCIVALEDQLHYIPAYPTEAVDCTGAGDAFCGTFLTSLLCGYDAVYSAYRAVVAASIIIEYFGVLTPLQVTPNYFEDRMLYFTEKTATSSTYKQSSGGQVQ